MIYNPILDHSKPIRKYFEEISRIPHNSGEEKRISDYVVHFAKERGLWYYQDSLWNVIVKKPASPGYESAAPVILQGHMDMVCIKTADSTHDFSKDPLDLYVEDGMLHARDTTLGADDGFGIAYMLAILDDNNSKHPPLECVFTTQEETENVGAKAFDASKLMARRMIGLDGWGETQVLVSCFCSDRIELTKKLAFQDVVGKIRTFKITLLDASALGDALHGDIVHQESGSAIKMAARLLKNLSQEDIPFNLCACNGGVAENFKPAECTVSFACESERFEKAKASILREFDNLMCEFETDEHTAEINFMEKAAVKGMVSRKISEQIVSLLYLLPNNVFQWNLQTNKLKAINNIGIVATDEETIKITMSTRCDGESSAAQLKKHCLLLASTFSFDIFTEVRYRPWAYNRFSNIRKIVNQVFVDEWGKPLEEEVCPGGLEISCFADKIPGLDAVILGPVIEMMHSVDECLELASFDRVYRALLVILARLKN